MPPATDLTVLHVLAVASGRLQRQRQDRRTTFIPYVVNIQERSATESAVVSVSERKPSMDSPTDPALASRAWQQHGGASVLDDTIGLQCSTRLAGRTSSFTEGLAANDHPPRRARHERGCFSEGMIDPNLFPEPSVMLSAPALIRRSTLFANFVAARYFDILSFSLRLTIAQELVRWLTTMPSFEIVHPNAMLALRGGAFLFPFAWYLDVQTCMRDAGPMYEIRIGNPLVPMSVYYYGKSFSRPPFIDFPSLPPFARRVIPRSVGGRRKKRLGGYKR
ncbi:hypothetical protein DFH06DRAFT_1384768 [Mycena polygramma]|nr:hypothetical protein DFH06DRAFT_1384768 [Mycena polygramma]